MESARKILSLVVLVAAGTISAQTINKAPNKTTGTPKKVVATASKRATGKRPATISSSTRRGRASSARDESSSGTKRINARKVVVTRKLVHGHWVRTTQLVHTTPAPSYQTHPDPERYQQIQQALASGGYFKGEVNGQWGDDSVAALKQFQTDHKLVNDGRISSLSLIGLGLGPNRETAANTPVKNTTDATPAPAPPAAAQQ